MAGERVLVADDDSLSREFLEEALASLELDVVAVEDGEKAISRLWEANFDLVFTDLKMPRADGLDVLEAAKKLEPPVPVVLITAHGTIEVAVAAMKDGAEDFLVKPASPEQIEMVVGRFREKRKLAWENRYLREEYTFSGSEEVVAVSAHMKHVLELADRVAPSKATVLITGESGVGKEVVATRIHKRSPRASKPFVRLNCAALSETLLESELFGHEKGAFTGAIRKKEGRFELADGGTLLLEEIAETGPALQAKLLRVLEKEEFERVGGTRTNKVDVRVIAATNKDLKEEVEKGNFREDLFFRLNVFPIHIPPLRERPEDIPVLVHAAIQKFGRKDLKKVKRINPAAMEILLEYPWPGNVRELMNMVQRALLLCEGEEITPGLISSLCRVRETRPKGVEGSPFQALVGMSMAEVEKNLIIETLKSCGMNRKKAADMLGISDRTLRNKLKSWGPAPSCTSSKA